VPITNLLMESRLKPFRVTARTATSCIHYSAIATSSANAAIDAAELFGDEPCSVTVTPLQATR
jgi:hypothetical protein